MGEKGGKTDISYIGKIVGWNVAIITNMGFIMAYIDNVFGMA